MDLVIASNDNPFGPCVRLISQAAAQESRRETEPIDNPNGISSVRVLRRPGVRFASLNTAYYERREESHNCHPSKRRRPPKRHFISCQRSNSLDKYEEHSISIAHVRKEPCRRRRKPGFRRPRKTTTEIVVVSEEEAPFSSLTPTCSRVRGGVGMPRRWGELEHGHGGQMLASTDEIPASLLLSLVKRSIDREADWFGHGRKRCLMDVVLDLRDRRLGHGRRWTERSLSLSMSTFVAGVAVGGLEPKFKRDLDSWNRTYTFRDQSSLDMYWNDQEAISTGSTWGNDNLGLKFNGFPVSVERSTATWPSEDEETDRHRPG